MPSPRRINGLRPRIARESYNPTGRYVRVAYTGLTGEFADLPDSFLDALASHNCYGGCEPPARLVAILEQDYRGRITGRVFPDLVCPRCEYTEIWDKRSGVAMPKEKFVCAR